MSLIPDWLIRRILAFVLGFALMGMWVATGNFFAGRPPPITVDFSRP